MAETCSHIKEINSVAPRTPNGCEECLKTGDSWVHLRLCEMCGHVGCCDDSKNKHATKHFRATTHPIIKSFELGEDWGWCYVDEIFFQPFPNAAKA
ncbi:MAG: UBP-type zinc finger domain-containing protein [Acidobacteriota bacterium]